VREKSYILESCCLSPIRRNSVLEELGVRRLAVIQEEKRSVVEHFVTDWCWSGNLIDERRRKVVCHLRIGGDLKKEIKQEY